MCIADRQHSLCRGPLSSGDAYLQERTALYKASQTLGLPAGHDFPFTNIITGKHFASHNPFNINQPFHEVNIASRYSAKRQRPLPAELKQCPHTARRGDIAAYLWQNHWAKGKR